MEICWYCKKVIEDESRALLHKNGVYLFHDNGSCLLHSLQGMVREDLKRQQSG